ncbi:MAG: hypothetical protein AB7I18_07375 [Candidatus Berkiella sp.]
MPKRYFIQIPGTVFPIGSAIVKPLVGTLLYSNMVTPWSTAKLIPMSAPPRHWYGISTDTAPLSCHFFEDLYEHIPEEQRFYFQWSGDLGEAVWDKNANLLNEELRSEFSHEDEEIEIVLLAHSHGGQIARKLAELLEDVPQVTFKIITVGTPLNSKITMPANVAVWQHFYHQDDNIQSLGSFFMQSWSSLIQPWSFSLQREMKSKNPLYQNHTVSIEFDDPHNDMIQDPRAAQFICEKAKPAIVGTLLSVANDSKPIKIC